MPVSDNYYTIVKRAMTGFRCSTALGELFLFTFVLLPSFLSIFPALHFVSSFFSEPVTSFHRMIKKRSLRDVSLKPLEFSRL